MSGLTGAFDPEDRLDCSRLPDTQSACAKANVKRGPLRISNGGPVFARTGRLCVFDGHLDNADALAGELRCASLPVQELLAEGYRRWGAGLLPRLRGEFALLLWDEQRGDGLLARDQLGVHSVFLCDAPGGLYFASEIHELLAMLPKRPAPDPVGVAHWIAVSGRPGPGTLYSGIRRLGPGSALLIDRRGARERRYWTARFSEPLELAGEELSGSVRGALEQAVGRRLNPHSPTGVLMSGGLDSASVAALAAERAPGHVRAYSGTFPDHPAVDETGLVDELRERLGLGGVTAQVRSGGLLASALESQAASQLPLVAWGDFWTLPLLRVAASDGVRWIVGGDGGDELFGARAYLLADGVRAGHVVQAVKLARELPGAGDHPPRREVLAVLRELALGGALPYRVHDGARRLLAGDKAPGWLLGAAARDLRGSLDPLAWKRLDGPRWWAHLAHGLTCGVEQTGVFEHQRLRATLAGVQARQPLFDLDLVELCLRIPPQASFDRHLNRPTLRAAMAGSLPDAVRLRPAKAWFDSLIVDCLNGPDRAAVVALLDDRNAELGAYVDLAHVRRALLETDPLSPGNDRFRWMHQLWRLVTAECWLRQQADPGGAVLSPSTAASRACVTLTPAGASAADTA
jgi:asparagine synthase (glutamine-hydrolysing)